MNIKDVNIGDDIICVDIFPNENTGIVPSLTIGKVYKILNIHKQYNPNYVIITINNDENEHYGYNYFRFSTLIEYRKLKLDKLNKISKI